VLIVRDAYYTSMLFAVSRNVTAPRDYGRSVAMIVLPDIKMLNEISKTDIRARQKGSTCRCCSPTTARRAIDLTPGAANYGHVNQQAASPFTLITGANLQAGDEKAQQLRAVIQDAFGHAVSDFGREQADDRLRGALRAQEKGQLLAPTMGRQEWNF
jgi:hypothetical protein